MFGLSNDVCKEVTICISYGEKKESMRGCCTDEENGMRGDSEGGGE
jgi:hypothetical protein